MNKDIILRVLEELEEEYHKEEGYSVKEILNKLKITYTREISKNVRKDLRSMISKNLHPEFLSAGDKDLVYCPLGKFSGKYRLSLTYRNNKKII